MIRIQDRIGELDVETDEERIYLREMHKERIRLNNVYSMNVQYMEKEGKGVRPHKYGMSPECKKKIVRVFFF